MTGDPLDRIEDFWTRTAQGDPSRYTGALSDIAALMVRQSADVLALVEVARAARDQAHDDDWCPVCCEHPSHGHAESCALARLDGAR